MASQVQYVALSIRRTQFLGFEPRQILRLHLSSWEGHATFGSKLRRQHAMILSVSWRGVWVFLNALIHWNIFPHDVHLNLLMVYNLPSMAFNLFSPEQILLSILTQKGISFKMCVLTSLFKCQKRCS